jgi:hypothetical protein
MEKRAILSVLALVVLVLLWLAWRATAARPGPELPEDAERPPAMDATELAVPPGSTDARAGEARAEAETPASGEPAPQAAPFRGQVVDAATGEPVPDALVVAGSFQAMAEVEGTPRAVLFGVHGLSMGEAGPLPAIKGMTDAEGRFVADCPLPDSVGQVSVMNPFHRTHIRSLPRERWLPLPGPEGWQFPIAIGPTFRLRIHGADPVPPETWRARLASLAEPPEDDEGWARLNPGDPPFLRYDNPVEDHDPRTRFFVEVRSEDGLFGGRVEASSVVGIHPPILDVWVEGLGVLTGRVLDEAGNGKRGARILALSARHGPGLPLRKSQAESDEEGSYRLQGLVPGRYWLEVLCGGWRPPSLLELDVPAGPSRAPDVVCRSPAPGGAIRGRLTSRTGARIQRAVVRLRALEGGFDGWQELEDGEDDYGGSGPGIEGFEFSTVPDGEYELTVASSDGLPWSPSSVLVSPPRQDVLFVREDDGALAEFVVRATDAATGEPLDRVLVQLDASGISPGAWWGVGYDRPFDTLPAGARLRWTVSAEGRVPVHGDERSFVPEGERRVATLKLSRGFGVRLMLRDCRGRLGPVFDDACPFLHESPPVGGAEVFADGARVGASDAGGIVDLALPGEPDRIEIRLPGWSVLGSPWFRDGRVLGEGALAPVWMRRD